MIDKQYHFLASLPKSGNSLLTQLLNQNTSLYTTLTSPLLDLLIQNERAWHKCPSVIANPYPQQLQSISLAIINGCWEHVPQNIIIDHHNQWPNNIITMQQVFKKEIKIIVTVRNIPNILNELSPQYSNNIDQLYDHHIREPYINFKTAYDKHRESLLFVDYDDLVTDSDHVMTNIYEFLQLPYYKHDHSIIKYQAKHANTTLHQKYHNLTFWR